MSLAGERLPLAIAHRGGRLLWPENTITAFSEAVGLGFRWVETDLHLTSDGVVVCLHDHTLERTTDGRGPVGSLTFDELQGLDAGWHHVVDGETPFRGRGVRVPALEEVVTAFPDLRLVVELKRDGLAAPLTELIRRHDLWGRLVVGSKRDSRLREVRAMTGGRLATSTGSGEALRVWLGAWWGRAPRLAEAVQAPRRYLGLPLVTPRTVVECHRAGMQVHVWTVDDPDEMDLLLDWGVDGIMSDRPDLLKEVLVRRGRWRPG